MKKIVMLAIICIFSITLTDCSHKKEENNQNQLQNETSDEILDVIEYSENLTKLISIRNLKPVSKELGLGNLYEGSGFDLYIGTDGDIELRNGESQNICISGVMIGDEITEAGKKLDGDFWLQYNSYSDSSYYIKKCDNIFYYVQIFYDSDRKNVDHWYLSNQNDEEDIEEIQAEYEVFQSVSETWKKEYIRFMEKDRMNFDNTFFYLIDINSDEIPELYISTVTMTHGDILCSYYDCSVISLTLWYHGLSYMEGQNLFMDSGGRVDEYHNIIYSMENGRFIIQNEGNYEARNILNIQYDENGEIIYDYYWNKIQVKSKEKYQKLLYNAFDVNKARELDHEIVYDTEKDCYTGDGIYNYQQILQAIKTY